MGKRGVPDWLHRLRSLTNGALVFLIATQLMIFSTAVLSRYALNRPISWAEEVTLHLMVWMVLLGTAVGVRWDTHPRVQVWGARFHRPIRVLTTICAVFFSLLIGFVGIVLAYTNRANESPVAGIPQWALYGAVPVASFLVLIEVAARYLFAAPSSDE